MSAQDIHEECCVGTVIKLHKSMSLIVVILAIVYVRASLTTPRFPNEPCELLTRDTLLSFALSKNGGKAETQVWPNT